MKPLVNLTYTIDRIAYLLRENRSSHASDLNKLFGLLILILTGVQSWSLLETGLAMPYSFLAFFEQSKEYVICYREHYCLSYFYWNKLATITLKIGCVVKLGLLIKKQAWTWCKNFQTATAVSYGRRLFTSIYCAHIHSLLLRVLPKSITFKHPNRYGRKL